MKTTCLVILAAAAVATSSCNTFIGLGRDMRIAGEGMEKTANKVTPANQSSGDTGGAPVY